MRTGHVETGSSGLFADPEPTFQPGAPKGVSFDRIVLAKGSATTSERLALAQAICAAFPRAEVREQFGVPHNRIAFADGDDLHLHLAGKRTLVLGEHLTALRQSEEAGNACPNYWHFSPYGFCPYRCHYCYLAGTPGVRFSPSVKVFLNLPEIMGSLDRRARSLGRPTAFYLGKLQDGLALDPLTGYSRSLVPFFADHPYARMTLLTKAADVSNLLGLRHNGHTILSWTINPPEVQETFEPGAPDVSQRIRAMRQCAAAGYPIRAVVMPIVPVPDWPDVYERLLDALLEEVPLERITLGSICIYRSALARMERKIGRGNSISSSLVRNREPRGDGRLRFAVE